jgi:hypothetical protein
LSVHKGRSQYRMTCTRGSLGPARLNGSSDTIERPADSQAHPGTAAGNLRVMGRHARTSLWGGCVITVHGDHLIWNHSRKGSGRPMLKWHSQVINPARLVWEQSGAYTNSRRGHRQTQHLGVSRTRLCPFRSPFFVQKVDWRTLLCSAQGTESTSRTQPGH